jgi:hypothetical protein
MARASEQSPNILAAPAIARGIAPTQITLDLSNVLIPERAQLELTVQANHTSTEPYVIVVSSGATNAPLGSFSFFPPPQPNEIRSFLIDADQIVRTVRSSGVPRLTLYLRLVPASDGSILRGIELRIVRATLIEG